MIRNISYFVIFGILALIHAAGCVEYDSKSGPLNKTVPAAITFMISSDTTSNFTPCGCRSGKWGGLPRRGTIFKDVSGKVDWPILYIDTGDVSQGSTHSDIYTKKDEYILEAYEVIDYDVVNVGLRDLNLGEELVNRKNTYDIPFVSSNIFAAGTFPAPEMSANNPLGGQVDTDQQQEQVDELPSNPAGEGTPIFPPYKVVEVDGAPGYKVAFIGALIQDAPRLAPLSSFSFEPYEEAIRQNVRTVRDVEHVDLVVVVSDADTLDNIDPSVFDGVDIVIGGNQTPVRSPNAALNPLNPMNAGQILTPPANTTTTGDTGEESVAEPATPEIPALETPLKIPKAAGRARKVTRFDITLNSAGEIVDYYFEEINVDDSFEDDPDMTEIMRGYDTEVHSVELSERITRNYAGSQACEECHVGFMAAWEGFGHFSTYDTIEQSDAISDASCVKCHAIGYVEEPRLVSYDLVPDTLRNIGCEGCHNNGYRHITLQNHIATLAPDMRDTVTTTDTMATDITASTCNVCHIGEWAQDFNFQEEFNRSKAICESVGN